MEAIRAHLSLAGILAMSALLFGGWFRGQESTPLFVGLALTCCLPYAAALEPIGKEMG